MGYGEEQRHRFPCHHCNEPISFGLLRDKIDVSGADLAERNEKTNYQYLSPDFVADSENSKDPNYFGSFELMRNIFNTETVKKALAKHSKGDFPQTGWFALSNAIPEWEKLLVCWRLERNGKHVLAVENLQAFAPKAGTSSWLAAVQFGHRLFGSNVRLLSEAEKILKSNEKEASRLVQEHGNKWTPDFLEAEFNIFNEFFKRWDAFSQVYLYVHQNLKMPENPTATSIDFEHVRGFYSTAQEFFSKQIVLLTAINNIKSGRSYDRLSQISLDRYLNSDNAKRRDNFKDNADLFSAASEYDSSLRNAEAHNWIKENSEIQRLHYLQGGNGTSVELQYVDYLHKSVNLFRQICQLMQLEAILRRIARQEAHRLFRTHQESTDRKY